MRTVIAQQQDTVDLLCFRHYGRTAGVTEAVLEVNPGLANYTPFLPMGLSVKLPDIIPALQSVAIQLWD